MEYGVTKQSLSSHQVGTELGLSWEQVGTKLGLSWEEVEKLFKTLQQPSLMSELKDLYGWRNTTKFKDKFVKPLIAENLVDMTIPNKPTSPNQKYYLTNLGKELLANEMNKKQADGVSVERVNRLIMEFTEALPQFALRLPVME